MANAASIDLGNGNRLDVVVRRSPRPARVYLEEFKDGKRVGGIALTCDQLARAKGLASRLLAGDSSKDDAKVEAFGEMAREAAIGGIVGRTTTV